MPKDVIIIGAGGHGKVISDIVRTSGDNFVGFLDDSTEGSNIIGTVSACVELTDNYFIVAIGNNKIRRHIVNQYNNLKFYTAIHPNAVVSRSAKIGEGTVVMPGSVINADAIIGKHCIINTCSSIDHDCRIGDFVHAAVGSRLCGTVSVGPETWIGAGATVSNNISICGHCMIGAGAVVIDNIDKSGTYVGVPVRRINANTNSCK